MVRWNDPKSLFGLGEGSTAATTTKDKKPAGKSDVLKALIPGQLARKAIGDVNAKVKAAAGKVAKK